MYKILIVEDSGIFMRLHFKQLIENNYDVILAQSAELAISYIGNDRKINTVIIDMDSDCAIEGDLLSMIKRKYPSIHIIALFNKKDHSRVVNLMSHGINDFLIKPFSSDKLMKTISQFTSTQNGLGDLVSNYSNIGTSDIIEPEKSKEITTNRKLSGFIGMSQIMQDTYDVMESAAKSDATIFITGESGTGKELCVEAVHGLSKRSNMPLIAINCAAIPKDLMESELFGHVKGAFTGAISDRKGAVTLANGGTLFLDEICEMPMELQSKLLRFLQDLSYGKVGDSQTLTTDVRIICATNKEPFQEVKNGNFREDLFYRLHVIPINMPPLRNRGSDVMDIAEIMLLKFSEEEGKSFKDFSNDMKKIIINYDWPGNVRQLQNFIRNIVVLHDGLEVTLSMLPKYMDNLVVEEDANAKNWKSILNNGKICEEQNVRDVIPLHIIEKEAIENAIEICGGNIPKAAIKLEVSPSTLYRKINHWEIKNEIG